ncbi:hypothetical protein [Alicyclobacillus dauci]|uniref:Uncharacterized protein n=1 Tax=Alicyclobacillus dauci TaxID=1475485 RepID=A0ABY6Z7A9_9BACL|nr:hypothetical protein [Alicyclobacillus dauci]WAH38775.1 hypothetical protein NZD86_09995 [Alicyclobacillus dauci]
MDKKLDNIGRAILAGVVAFIFTLIPDFDGFVLFELTRIIEKALPVRLR